MNEQEKDLLKRVPLMKMEAKAALYQISLLSKKTGMTFEKETNKWLDRLDWLDKLEKELKNKK
jgi:hypothetical protein